MKTILFIILIALPNQSVRKFRARLSNQRTDQTEWTSPVFSDALIVSKDMRISIYDDGSESHFDVIGSTTEYDPKTGQCLEMKCIDSKGKKCEVLVYSNDDEGVYSIVISYADFKKMYLVDEI